MKFHFLKKEDQFALVMLRASKETANYPQTKSKLMCWWLFFLMLENKLYQQVKVFKNQKHI